MLRISKFVVALILALGSAAFAFADLSPVDLLNRGRADEAIRTLNQQVNGSASPESYHLLCRAYYAVQDFDNSIHNGERAVQLNPNNATYRLWLGRAYGEKASQAGPLSAFSLARKTVAAFEKAVQLDPADWRARRDLAEYYVEAPAIVGGGKDKARRLADDVVSSDPTTAAWIRAIVAMQDKNTAEAEVQLHAAIKASGNSGTMWLELARFYKQQQRWNDFDSAMKQVFNAPRKGSTDLFDAGEMMIRANRDLPQAMDALRKYLDSGRTDEYGPAFKAHYLIGQGLEKQGKSGEAQAEYRAALSLASNFRPAQDALHKLGG
jgi:tetratricopeptide (TPR) repeat protein